MNVVDHLKMFSITVASVPKSKEFYTNILGLKVKEDHREDDDNWWVTLEFPGGGAMLTIGKASKYGIDEPLKAGMAGLYIATSDIEAAHEELGKKGIKTGEIMDDLFGPGSAVKFFNIEDPDGNSINVLQDKE